MEFNTTQKILNGNPSSYSVFPDVNDLTIENSSYYFDIAAKQIFEKPFIFEGSGIVMCAGGKGYLTNAWININMIRHFGCNWPIQIWHLGIEEIPGNTKEIFEPLGVEFINADYLAQYIPHKKLNGWPLKSYALKHTTFKDVMFLDADSIVLKNFEFLFNTKEYITTGAIFWQDIPNGRFGIEQHLGQPFEPDDQMWKLTNIEYRPTKQLEAGQICIDRDRYWNELCLANWMNNHSNFYYNFIYGDKDTFNFSCLKLNKKYTLSPRPINVTSSMIHIWFNQEKLFQHFAGREKYNIEKGRSDWSDIIDKELHMHFYEQLKNKWNII